MGSNAGAMQAVGKERVGVRLTPYGRFLDAYDSNPKELFNYVVTELGKRNVLHVHMIEARIKGNETVECPAEESLDGFAELARNAGVRFIAAGGFTKESAAEALRSDKADLVCCGCALRFYPTFCSLHCTRQFTFL
jgi:N-ethylmaleimide reductase